MYICIEGIDGAGKSTQLDYIKEWLIESGFEAKKVHEPTDSSVGKLLRKLLKNSDANCEDMQKVFGLLFAADRLILKNELEKYEDNNEIIISDRSFYSSLAYQPHEDWICSINKYVKKPDLVILIDITPDLAIKRCLKHDTFENKFFLNDVRENYLKIASNKNFKIVDGSNGVNKVKSDIKKLIAPLLGICIDGIR
ncbi:MAG: dTMP kinase [Methanobrevibacter sp.]|jgi:dTMP kinase|nr:dTMP kinase [Candidatus Methanovirga basalitermitum]